ncbi:MAG: hypothetical protein ACWA5R_09270 [bacterium]
MIFIAKYVAELIFEVPISFLKEISLTEPDAVRDDLVEQASAFMRSQQGGYFPGFETLEQSGLLDEELSNTSQSLIWISSQYVREKLQKQLKVVFSQVSVKTVRPLIYTMPKVRKNDPNAHTKLMEHYSCNRIRARCEVSQVLKKQADELSEEYYRKMLWKWLKNEFDAMEIIQVELL